MKRYFWIVDEWGCMNFFDNISDFRHARKHIHGMMEGDTFHYGDFKAENVEDCWATEDVLKWKDGISND